jgi:F-type H+-transporting ATPase subunit b
MANQPPELFTTDDPEMVQAMEGANQAGEVTISEHSAHDAAAGHTEQPDGSHEGGHAEGPMFIFGPGGWVGFAMLVFLLILLWKGVHKMILGGLDSKIAAIKQQLDEAKALRAEAEALRDEYAAKIKNAEKDAAAMIEHAESEAGQIVAKAKKDTDAMIARRKKMAEDKIAAAERGVVEELRAKAADAATRAAGGLIASKHDASADSKLVDKAISGL